MAGFADPTWQREAARRSLELRRSRAAIKFQLKTAQISFLDACANRSIWGLKLIQVLEFAFAHSHASSGRTKSTRRAAAFAREHQLPINTTIEQLKMPTLRRIQALLDEHPNYAYGRRQRQAQARAA